MLTLKQQKIYSEIEKIISVNNNNNDFIYFEGPIGSGKSKIILDFISKVLSQFENWSFYYIEGKDPLVESYATITLSNSDKIKLNNYQLSNVNFNLGFSIPTIMNLGITTSFKKNSIFNDKTNSVFVDLNNDVNENIVIIADSFQLWDSASQELLNTIINYPNVLKDKRVIVLIIADEDDSAIEKCNYINRFKKKSHNIKIKMIDKDELKEISKVLGYTVDLTNELKDIIMSLTGGNISFIKMFLEEYTDSKSDNFILNYNNIDIMNLLDNRMDQFGEKKEYFIEVLEVSSIPKGTFNSNEIKYIYNKDIVDVEAVLDESQKASILKGEAEFMFSNYLVRNLFYKKLNGKSKIFHKKYAEYLKKYKPENYISRAYHLKLSNSNNIIEIINLLTIAYCRSLENNGNFSESNSILMQIEKLKDESSSDREIIDLYDNFINLKSAYESYYQEMYDDANNKLLKIPMIGPFLFTAEVARFHLIVKSLIDMDTENIYEATKVLSGKMDDLYTDERDEWCRCALVLFSTYANKLNDYNSSKEVYNQLEKLLNKSHVNSSLQYLKNIIFRKACIFQEPVQAVNYTSQSIKYFYENVDIYQYYLSCCNHSGNLIILGEYDEAINSLYACLNSIRKYKFIKFPTQSKIYNNLYLAYFLRNYYSDNISKEYTIKMKKKFEKLINDQYNESNAIIHINLINICAILGEYNECFIKLNTLENEILDNNDDEFYKYYLCNIKFALNSLTQNWEEATKNLNELNTSFPNYFTKIKRKINYRNKSLQLLLEGKITLLPKELDKWVYENSKKDDCSCNFFCRLFLFSDLQFTSL
ncbi:MAG: ATP-binding protein [Clostridium beijerinckii]|jgi:hypothetical protein|uniref:ATP-binding protein n=1 Tax=Clostridium TaxID=1485 RepID=UPI000CF91C89|nr:MULTISPECIES: ATP-binding protein [Clostridium]AVK46890.1 hypothetical protein AXY43_01980 [Clostridium sp. MF28]MCI1583475.1 ATP-binding protein [Clostridium beijerinckii]MCI1623681.1 ATP-binding protein [Clostridium beijerinckii]PSM59429.1 hypothetical protein C4L39_01430 [Clostridium diolis]